MSSWFNKLSDLSEKVQSSVQNMEMPQIDSAMLEKLTLTTPELRAERERIDKEEKRKERARMMLAGMLPWETRDHERDMLVDECKEAVLLLSTKRETFFGPYAMPPLTANIKDDDDEEAKEEEDSEKDLPTKESLEKLAKLEPLPPLLANFDFRAHVGLIEKVLKEDPNLVEMQSTLSGGGPRERIFWHNYFFHCAFTRYEAGLSIDEIWSDMPDDIDVSESVAHVAASVAPEEQDVVEEETITFDGGNSIDDAVPSASVPTPKDSSEGGEDEGLFGKDDIPAAKPKPATARQESDFELVEGDSSNGAAEDVAVDDSMNTEDYELDELEAEIARELED